MSRTHEVLNQPPPLVDYDLTAGALLARHARPEVFDGFAAARLAGGGGHLYGILPPGLDLPAIIEPAIPSMLG